MVVLAPGETLIEEGDATHSGDLMIVSYGQLEVTSGTFAATLFQDQLVGEVTFLRGGVPSATVRAGAEGAIVQVVRPSVISAFLQDPNNAVSFYGYLCYVLGQRCRSIIDDNRKDD